MTSEKTFLILLFIVFVLITNGNNDIDLLDAIINSINKD